MTIEAGLTGYYDPCARDLSAELAALILRKDELRFHEAKNIRAEYMMKVGAKELAVWRKSIEYRRQKRRLSKFRAYINRGEQPDVEKVEAELEEEFNEYEEKIRERAEEVRKALFWLECEELTEEQTKELRDMYTKVVKRLHPDLNPDADQKDIETYYMAVSAYKDADLDKMRAIFWVVIDDQEAVIPEVDLKAKIIELRAEIEMIERSFPFDKREFLKDAEAVAERNRELDEMMDDYMEQIKLVNAAIYKLRVRP